MAKVIVRASDYSGRPGVAGEMLKVSTVSVWRYPRSVHGGQLGQDPGMTLVWWTERW